MKWFNSREWPAAVAALLVVGVSFEAPAYAGKQKKTKGGSAMAMTLTSPAFAHNAKIPSRYTCDAEDISPALSWSGAPDGTKSFALIGDDPDAPAGTWVHWVVWNIPPDTSSLPENLPKTDKLPNGALQGLTDFQRVGYGGPCPPSGTHRYFFKLYALDTLLNLPPRATKSQLERDMKGRILAEAQIIGLYSRSK